jgi:large subunit ribosomal protein L17
MRHGKKFNHLGRKREHRAALLMNLSKALIQHKRISTTLAKGKALRVHIEPLITKAKENTTHSRRVVFSYIQDKEMTAELFGPIAEKVANRPGGYTRILRTGFRKGDNAEMCMIELVDFNELRLAAEASSEKKTRRRRAKKSTTTTTPAAPVAPVVEDVVEDVKEEENND